MAVAVAGMSMQPAAALAHCDALDGPVVRAARLALEKGDVRLVLRWVPPESEAEVRSAFDRTASVRALGENARELADTWFFETLVRIHRAGEGAPFDGLKPAGRIEPFVEAVDRSLVTGSLESVGREVTADVNRGLRERFALVRERHTRADASIDAGRKYVAAYVDYLHYVEALHRLAAHGPAEHGEAAGDDHEHQP